MAFTRRGEFVVPALPATLTDFPVLVSITNNDFKLIANGGYVANANGYDIRFFSNLLLTSALPFVLKFYDGTTGQIAFWVKLSTMTSGMSLYCGMGDAALNTNISSVSNTFTSIYNNVISFYDAGGGTLGAKDWITGVTGTVNGATLVAGLNGWGASFDGVNDNIDFGTGNYVTTGEMLVTSVVKPASLAHSVITCIYNGSLSDSQFLLEWSQNNPGDLAYYNFAGSGADAIVTVADPPNVPITAGSWYMIHGQRRVGGPIPIRVFKNGSYWQANTTGTSMNTTPAAKLMLGSDQAGNAPLDGIIDMIYVHKSSRGQGENPSTPGTIYYWPYTEYQNLLYPGSFLGYSSDPAPTSSFRPKFWAWAPRFTMDTAPLAAFSWEIAKTTFGIAGYKHVGIVRLTYISSADASLTFTVDGTAQSSITVASSSGVQAQAVFRVPVMKGRLFGIAITCASEFRLDTASSYIEIKNWGGDGPYNRMTTFGQFAMVEG